MRLSNCARMLLVEGSAFKPMCRSRSFLLASIAIGFAAFPFFASASVVINEVLFDPTGSDTGQEIVELYNPSSEAVDLAAWQLYPDGIGYFTFPSFALQPDARVLIHLRVSGANDDLNLYHSTATGNMGNSSGSVALFKPGARGADTIVDFVRYHKPGSAERKTWESAAVEAVLWAGGDFINISALAEGQSLALKTDGARGGTSAWMIQASPSFQQSGVSQEPPESPADTDSSFSESNSVFAGSGRPLPASLRVWAGEDITAIAGSSIVFRGTARGLNGEALSGVRTVWNFGDGSWGEGQAVLHVYRFPGTYYANLSVQSGELTGSDWRTITVLPSGIFISEALPGPDGFVEIANTQKSAIDLSGILIIDDQSRSFRVRENTRLGSESAIVFASAATGLDPREGLSLRDAAGREIDRVSWHGFLGPEMSWKRSGKDGMAAGVLTPGLIAEASPFAETSAGAKASAEAGRSPVKRVVPPSEEEKVPVVTGREQLAVPTANLSIASPSVKEENAPNAGAEIDGNPSENLPAAVSSAALAKPGLFSSKFLFPALAVAGSLLAGIVFFVVKRMAA